MPKLLVIDDEANIRFSIEDAFADTDVRVLGAATAEEGLKAAADESPEVVLLDIALKVRPTRADRFGLVRPAVDAHTLGISSVAQILQDCGYASITANAVTCEACGRLEEPQAPLILERWIRNHSVNYLGVSYRLDPCEGVRFFGLLLHHLRERRLLLDYAALTGAAPIPSARTSSSTLRPCGTSPRRASRLKPTSPITLPSGVPTT